LLIEVPGRRIRVLAGDHQPLFRDALARVVRQRIAFELVAEVDDGRAALDAIGRLRPDVAVLSVPLPSLDGERVLNAVVRDALPTRVLLLTDASAPAAAYRAIECGAAGCLTKSASADQLCDAITTAARGGVFVDRDLQTVLASEIRLRRRHEEPVLTARECEVLRLVADGMANTNIAEALGISLPTVKTHLAHVYEKLGTSDRAAAVAEAMRHGLLE
jgi:two-component system nitrate/nitrite response regulator NarL